LIIFFIFTEESLSHLVKFLIRDVWTCRRQHEISL